VQNLERALGRDNRRLLLLTLNDWAGARAAEFWRATPVLDGSELFVTFRQR